MRLAGLLLAAALPCAYSHDEGHGPKLNDSPPFGGLLAAVIEAKDAALGPKAALVYKAELVRSEEGTVRVWLYDKDLRPLDPARFAKNAGAVLEIARKRKVTRIPFALELKDGVFIGKAPRAPGKPFNIDVTVTEGKRKLLCAFDNLD